MEEFEFKEETRSYILAVSRYDKVLRRYFDLNKNTNKVEEFGGWEAVLLYKIHHVIFSLFLSKMQNFMRKELIKCDPDEVINKESFNSYPADHIIDKRI